MLDADWRVHDTEGPTLVAVVVANAAPTPRRVRVRSLLDAPVLVPQRRGLTESGWDDEGFEGVVPADATLPLGFAADAPPADPPVEVDDRGRAEEDPDGGPSPADVVRALASPAPPSDAVPSTGRAVAESACDASETAPGIHVDEGDGPQGDAGLDGAQGDDPVPPPVADWPEGVADRVDRAATLAAADDVDGAAAAVDAAGGLAAVEALIATLATDEAALRAVAERASATADDCGVRSDVPLAAYRRLA